MSDSSPLRCGFTVEYPWNGRTIRFTCVAPKGHTDAVHYSDAGTEWPNHKTSGGYGPHDWDCPACKADSEKRADYRKTQNPHRPGTKAAAKWDRMRSSVDWAMDLRGETYWSS